MIGAHSMMDRPEPVRRVAPPSVTITRTMAQRANSQSATGRKPGRRGSSEAKGGSNGMGSAFGARNGA